MDFEVEHCGPGNFGFPAHWGERDHSPYTDGRGDDCAGREMARCCSLPGPQGQGGQECSFDLFCFPDRRPKKISRKIIQTLMPCYVVDRPLIHGPSTMEFSP